MGRNQSGRIISSSSCVHSQEQVNLSGKKDDDDEKILSLFTPPNKKNQRGVTRDPKNFLFHLAHNFFIFIGECKIEDRQNLL
jgi:hypothetical protein